MNQKSLAAAIGAIISFGVLPGLAHAQSAQEEVDKQIAKAIGDAINSRVSTTAASAAPPPPNSAWATAGILSIDSNTGGQAFDLSIPTVLIGYDRDLRGKAMVGASLAFYGTSGTIGIADISMYGWTLSPYFAYLFNKNIFATAKLGLGFSYLNSESTFTAGGFRFESESDAYTYNLGLDVSLNGLYRAGNALLKGLVRVGRSSSSTDTDTSNSTYNAAGTLVGFTYTTTSTSSSATLYGLEGEFGYFFAPRSYGFVGAAMSESSQANSNQIFARIGYEQQFGKAAAVGAKYERKIADDLPGNTTVNVESFFVTFRAGF